MGEMKNNQKSNDSVGGAGGETVEVADAAARPLSAWSTRSSSNI